MDEPLFYMPCDHAPEGVATRLCRECEEHKPLHLFAKQAVTTSTGKVYFHHRCLICTNKQGSLRSRLHCEGACERLWHEQDGKCAIDSCSIWLPIDGKGPGNRLNLDHNHVTGAARGLLCLNHNQGLGKFDDNADSLLEAVIYLNDRHPLAAIITAYLQTPAMCKQCGQPTEGDQQ
jgi:hypothetical protein